MFYIKEQSSNLIKESLKFDPLYEAEKITGESYKEDKDTEALGLKFMLQHTKFKNELLQAAGDTCHANNWDENLQVIEDLGFQVMLTGQTQNTEDEWRIYYRAGILLFCESYNKGTEYECMNSGSIYFNFRVKGDISGYLKALEGCNRSGIDSGDENVHQAVCSYDIREGLRNKILELEEEGEILEQWIEQGHLWMLNYQDTKTEGWSSDDINRERLSKLPSTIQLKILNTTKEHIEG